MAIRLGMDAYLAYDPNGLSSFTEIQNVRDLTLTLESAEADVTIRGNAGWRANVATLREASVEFEMVWDTADQAFQDIMDAYINNTSVGLRIWDQQTNGSGLSAMFTISSLSRSESLEEALTASVSAKVTYDLTNPPEWSDGSNNSVIGGSGA